VLPEKRPLRLKRIDLRKLPERRPLLSRRSASGRLKKQPIKRSARESPRRSQLLNRSVKKKLSAKLLRPNARKLSEIDLLLKNRNRLSSKKPKTLSKKRTANFLKVRRT